MQAAIRDGGTNRCQLGSMMDVPTPGIRGKLPQSARAYIWMYLLHAGGKKVHTVGSQEGRRFPITAKMLKVRKHVMDTKYSDQNNKFSNNVE